MVGFEFVVDHLMDLLLQEPALFIEEDWLFIELVAEGVFGDFEVVFDDNEGILEGFFQDFHLFLDVY